MGWVCRFHPLISHQFFAAAATSLEWRLLERYDPLAHPVRLWYHRRIRGQGLPSRNCHGVALIRRQAPCASYYANQRAGCLNDAPPGGLLVEFVVV